MSLQLLRNPVYYKMPLRAVLTCFVFLFFLINNYAQPGAEIEVKKPERYENRKLGSEKTGQKKFTVPKRIYQNTVTHYNYYFNANNRLNEVIARAKDAFKDDYAQLLPFYNYTLQATSQDKQELDSIIYKATAGILLHDLRNDWIDNMYLLLGKAYFFRNDLDSAELTLQYINFAFAPKEPGGYDIPIGSNASNETGEFSIATNEKKNVFKKLITHQPSRNESFIWQIRNHIEKNELPEAAGLIEILRSDPKFPKRLDTDLNEVFAYWFYKQGVYDSAANYLGKALHEAGNNQEKARWEYLIGQMYQLAGDAEKSVNYYGRSIKHTSDPVMDVFARLNSIRVNKTDKKDYIQNNIDALVKMARRDKYENYRDIIYYAAATIELERKGYKNAEELLLKSVAFTKDNPQQRSQSFMLLGDLNFDQKEYVRAHNFYDSVDLIIIPNVGDKERISQRKTPLQIIAENAVIIATQDSLQALAKLPADKRDAQLKKISKELRKAQGIKEEDNDLSINPAIRQSAPDLFANTNKDNDFYFYNASLKARGFSEFKSKWGERPNIDNWRRIAMVNKQNPAANNNSIDTKASSAEDDGNATSVAGLLANLPLTQEKIETSDKDILNAMLLSAKTLSDKLEDFASAVQVYEEILKRFPNTTYRDEILFNLVYAAEKSGNKVKATEYKNMLMNATPASKWAQQLKAGNTPSASSPTGIATKQYEDIYSLFIEGKFDEAKMQKQAADSVYGKTYWTPQLLFIEAIYYVKQQQDSTAIQSLNNLISLHGTNPMAEKAKTMVEVLKRRTEIEDYLTKLAVIKNENEIAKMPKPVEIIVQQKPVVLNPSVKKDSLTAAAPVKTTTAPPLVVSSFTFNAADPHYVVVLMDKVDEVYAGEARNAFNRYNKEKFYNQKIDINSLKLDDRFNLILQGPFDNAQIAVDYIDKVKPATGSRILPWLGADKYSFITISNANLDILKISKDMAAYRQLLQKAFPGKF